MIARLRTAVLVTGLAATALASAAPTPEFTPQGRAYESDFGRAAAELMRLVKEDEIEVLAVAEFTDMDGKPSYIGKVFAEEFATLLVTQATGKKRARVLDPNSIDDFIKDEDSGNPLASNKALKRFGKASDAELLLSGKVAIAADELRLFLRALNTDSGTIRWASTLVVQGRAAGLPEPAAPVASATPLVAVPALAAPTPSAPAFPAPAVGAPVVAAPNVMAPAVAAPLVAVPTAFAPLTAGPAPLAAPSVAAPVVAAPTVSAPPSAAPAAAAPVDAAPAGAAPLVAPPTLAPVLAAPVLATPSVATPPASVTEFDNGVLRASLRSLKKFPDQGWATAVIEFTNRSGAPLAIDIAAGDPGTGTDDKGNAWKVERVTGLKLSDAPSADMTAIAPGATMPVVLVLTTSGRPLGDLLGFTTNVLWHAPGSQDGGRLAIAFERVELRL